MRRSPGPRGPLAVASLADGAALALHAVAVVFVVFVVLFGGARPAACASRDRRFFNARLGLGLEAPGGWTLSLHTGYAEILCVLLHPDGSRISLAEASTKAADARGLAEESRRGIEAQHFTIARIAAGPRGGVLLEARDGSRAELRQLYLVRPAGGGKAQGVVLTLSTRPETLATASSAFEWAVAHLELEPPADLEEPPKDAGAPAGHSPAAGAADGGSAARGAGAEGQR